jgi:hypothetical protein
MIAAVDRVQMMLMDGYEKDVVAIVERWNGAVTIQHQH